MKRVVLDAGTLGFAPSVWSDLAAGHDPVLHDPVLHDLVLHDRTPANADTIVERAAGAAIVMTNKVPLTAEIFARLPELRLVCVLATGYNVVDTAAAAARGIAVCNVPGYSTDAVAQHTFALLLELCHQVGEHTRSVMAGDWVRSPHFAYWRAPLVELAGATLGLVGFGAIGRRVGAIAQGFGMRVIASVRRPPSPPESGSVECVPLDELLARSDVVSLHCPLTPETRRLINAASLARMKRTAFLINTGRGDLVDEPALAAALRDGTIAGAGVDVISREPMPAGHPFLGVPNLVITPHMAWTGEPSRRRILEVTRANVDAFLRGASLNRIV